LEIDPMHSAALFNLGSLLFMSNNRELGMEKIRQAVEQMPNQLAWRIELGTIYMKLQHLDSAKQQFF